MTVLISSWKCSCGAEFDNARDGFLHRDGSDFHQVTPSVSKLTGIEKRNLQTQSKVNAQMNVEYEIATAGRK